MYKDFLLQQVLEYLFNGDLGVVVKKDFSSITFHLQQLKIDIERINEIKLLSENKPPSFYVSEMEHMFYPFEKIEAIRWDSKTIESIEHGLSLLFKIKYILNSSDLGIYEKRKKTGE